MILIVGLGNPGIKYKRTRHNMGFRVLDEFQKENDFPDFKFSKKFNALISKKNTGKEKIILAKPETFMNKSGQTVKKLSTYYSLPTTSLIVVHDDIDLPLGKIRISKKFNALISKKNTGKEKIILGKPETFMNKSGQTVKKLTTYYSIPFINLIIVHDDIDLPLGKIRISKSRGSAGHKGVESIIKESGSKNFIRLRIGIRNQESGVKNSEKFVLKNFTKEEEKIVEKITKKSCSALKMILSKGLEKAMNEFNKDD